MTYKEALKHFKSLQKRYTTQHNGVMCEKVEVAIEAIEKQIPKKPIKTGVKHCYYVFYCPLCKNEVGVEKALYSEFEHHCICGQAIDWGEE